MSGIDKVNNGVRINGSSTPYGGNVVGLQYSISFQGSSSLSVTIANDSGIYKTPSLDAENPVVIEFGSSKMKVLPMSYRKSMGSGGRTLTVNFDDMGIKYLDKNLVLLKHQHLEKSISSCAMVLGEMYATDERGVERRYYGSWKSGIIKVAYDIRDLADAIQDQGIPVSSRFLNYLRQFKVHVRENETPQAPNSFLRTDIGPLRSVLASIATDLGFVPFWNANDEVDESENQGVVNGKPNQGYLDFVRFEDDIDVNVINSTVDSISDSCNIEDDSYEVSIKNSFLKGGIGYFEVNPPLNMGRQSHFTRFQFREYIESPYVPVQYDGKIFGGALGQGEAEVPSGQTVEIKGNYGLELLMRAAQMGPEFYKNYVVLKLCCAALKNFDSVVEEGRIDATLKARDQSEAENAAQKADASLMEDRWSYIGRSVRNESAKEFPLNMVENPAVNTLYSGPSAVYNDEKDDEGKKKGWELGPNLFDVLPTIYSLQQGQTLENWRDSIPKGPLKGTASAPLLTWAGDDTRFHDIFEDETFLEELREKFKLADVFSAAEIGDVGNVGEDDGAVAPSEFVGVAYRKSKAMFEFLNNPSECPVFKELLWLSENYGRWFSMADVSKVKADQKIGKKPNVDKDQEKIAEEIESLGGALITQNVFNTRKYIEDVSWVFSDLAAPDTDLADIYKFTLTDTDGKRRDADYKKRAPYTMVKAGQSDCGLGLEDNEGAPANVISPDTQILTVNGYRCIVGIHRMLSSFGKDSRKWNQGANAMPRKTTCAGSIADEFIISSIYDVQVGPSFKSFALETMVVRSSRLFKNLPSERFELTGLGDIQNVGQEEEEGAEEATDDRCLKEGEAGSIPQTEYSFIQDYRVNCSLNLNSAGVEIGGVPRPAAESGEAPKLFPRKEAVDGNGVPISFRYDDDRDYGVVLHKHGQDPSVLGEDIEIAFSSYNKSNVMGNTDLWVGLAEEPDEDDEGTVHQGSAYLSMEIIQIGPETYRDKYDDLAEWDSPLGKYSTYWTHDLFNAETDKVEKGDHIEIDYWDYRLFKDVSLGIKLDALSVLDMKVLAYSFTVEDLLQSIRCSYIPNKNFSKIASMSIDPVKFDIGELLEDSSARYEYPICGGGNSSLARLGFQSSVGDLDLKVATKNLLRIMQSYVDENISPSISRDFVVSGFGFKSSGTANPYLPSIYNGLESVSISIGEQGVKTTVKIGNKRRMRASKELRASRVVSGLAGGDSSVAIPDSVQNSFSTALKAKM